MVTEVLRAQGYTPQVDFTSWSLAEKRAATGETIGAFPLVGSESRRSSLLLSEPLVEFQYVLFYDRSRGEPLVRTPDDLAGLRVGRIAGYDYWSELEDAVPGFVEYPTSTAAFRALADGEIDLLPEGLLSGRAVLDDPRFDPDPARFGHLPGDDPLVRSTEGLYFVMPRTAEAAAVMRDFDAGLAALKGTDTYTRIVTGLTEGGADVEVLLEPVDDADLVELFAADGTPALVAPRGTRARVLSWPAPFVSAAGEATEGLLVPVKLLNGPAQGRVFQVDARALALTGSD
nr:transporter substrate-binding domain-containing protein [Blastococcus saxobsidens]